MDIEGIDVGILFRTWATHAINIDGLEPAFAAAMSRAWNRWIADFCQEHPERLKPSGLVPLQEIDLAVAEARFAVQQLGAITLVLPSHPMNGRPPSMTGTTTPCGRRRRRWTSRYPSTATTRSMPSTSPAATSTTSFSATPAGSPSR